MVLLYTVTSTCWYTLIITFITIWQFLWLFSLSNRLIWLYFIFSLYVFWTLVRKHNNNIFSTKKKKTTTKNRPIQCISCSAGCILIGKLAQISSTNSFERTLFTDFCSFRWFSLLVENGSICSWNLSWFSLYT